MGGKGRRVRMMHRQGRAEGDRKERLSMTEVSKVTNGSVGLKRGRKSCTFQRAIKLAGFYPPDKASPGGWLSLRSQDLNK